MEVIGQLKAPAALTMRKIPQHPLDRRMHGPRSGLEVVAKRKIITSSSSYCVHFDRVSDK
jgi:hypothetical protein